MLWRTAAVLYVVRRMLHGVCCLLPLHVAGPLMLHGVCRLQCALHVAAHTDTPASAEAITRDGHGEQMWESPGADVL